MDLVKIYDKHAKGLWCTSILSAAFTLNIGTLIETPNLTPAGILQKSIAVLNRPVSYPDGSYPDGPITARYRFM